MLVNVAALEKGAYTGDQAQKFFANVREKLESGISYVTLLDYLNVNIAGVNKAAGIALIIIGPDVPAIANIGGTKIVSDCDRELMLLHIAKQELLLAFYQ
jgi:hypothetical protein